MLNYRIEKKSPNAQHENEDMGILAMELWYIGSFQVFLPDIVAFFYPIFFPLSIAFSSCGWPHLGHDAQFQNYCTKCLNFIFFFSHF